MRLIVNEFYFYDTVYKVLWDRTQRDGYLELAVVIKKKYVHNWIDALKII